MRNKEEINQIHPLYGFFIIFLLLSCSQTHKIEHDSSKGMIFKSIDSASVYLENHDVVLDMTNSKIIFVRNLEGYEFRLIASLDIYDEEVLTSETLNAKEYLYVRLDTIFADNKFIKLNKYSYANVNRNFGVEGDDSIKIVESIDGNILLCVENVLGSGNSGYLVYDCFEFSDDKKSYVFTNSGVLSDSGTIIINHIEYHD